jgi:EmrB/QacA subfamily drug resistance transporter
MDLAAGPGPKGMNENSTRRWTVGLTAIGSFMAALDTLVVAAALSTIRIDLGASVGQLEWTVNAYNLSFGVLLITAAALGDRLGRRRMYATGLTVFALASAACALAPSVGWLIAFRAIQGAGGALVMPLALALLSAAFPPDKRGVAIGMFSAITGIAVALGPLVGGAVVEGIDWEWIFWLNVPIGLVAAPLVLAKVTESRGGDSGLDLPGLGLISAGAFGIVWALVRANEAGWGSLEIVGSLAAGLAFVGAFVAWERRAPEPMLPLRFFRSRAFAAGNGAIFMTFASLFGCVFLFAQFLQTALGYGALETGLRLMPWTITFILVAPGVGALADRIGERPLMATGLFVEAAGLAWLALIADPAMSYSQLIGPFVVAGIGVSMAIPSGQNAVVRGISLAEVGKAAGANSMMRELGGVFGIAILVAVFAGAGGYASAAAFVDGFAPAVAVAAGLAAVGGLVALALPAGKPVEAPALGREPAAAKGRV